MSASGGEIPIRVHVKSEAFGLSMVTAGVAAGVIAIGSSFALLRPPSLIRVAAVGAVVLAIGGAGLRMFLSGLHGGVTVFEDRSVLVRGGLRSARLAPDSASAIVVKRDGANEPSGWLKVGSREIALKGATGRHRHGAGGGSDCGYCASDLKNLQRIAAALRLPVEDGGRRPGSIPGFW